MCKKKFISNIIKVWYNKISSNLVRNKVMIQISKLKKETKKLPKSNNSTKNKAKNKSKDKNNESRRL